jgi:thiol-disulfide isomerase/thioredoxin
MTATINLYLRSNRLAIWGLLVIILPFNVHSQNRYPAINSSVESLVINNVENTKDGRLHLSRLDQYLILDFWTSGCSSCMEAFPKMNDCQKKYQKELKIVLVGLPEKNRSIEKFYKFYKKKFNLNLTSVYDSSLFDRFVYSDVPHLVWINKEGRIKAITSTADLTESNIDKFIQDKSFDFVDKSYSATNLQRNQIDRSKPLLINGNGGRDTDYMFRSILAMWDPRSGRPFVPDLDHYNSSQKFWYQTTGALLQQLYMVAYFGTNDIRSASADAWPWPILNIKDSTLFLPNKGRYTAYNYSVEAPATGNKSEQLTKLIQSDLKKYFGYSARLIYQDMQCFKLVAIDQEKLNKLKTNGGEMTNFWNVEQEANIITNYPIDGLPNILISALPAVHKLAFDETGFKGNVDLHIQADITDLNSIRQALRNQGLDLLTYMRRMHVLEISDSQNY